MNNILDSLKQCHADNKALVSFLAQVADPKKKFSGKYNVSLSDVSCLFEKKLWIWIANSTGHAKWKHPLSEIIIEYSNHQDPVDPASIMNIFNRCQSHLDFFKKKVFKEFAKNRPDFEASMVRYNKLEKPLEITIIDVKTIPKKTDKNKV